MNLSIFGKSGVRKEGHNKKWEGAHFSTYKVEKIKEKGRKAE